MFLDSWLDWCFEHIGPISIAAMAVATVIAVELMIRIKERENKK